ncbi:hypothetical protein CIHG_01939 [Coccidioides immitis H538.4]|uniref:Uncharacterized protein n=3 Tax=Coccidioides immitis TaxID=5501 RepID=A0A0J8QMQ9_COCIT|nr:hypothetical protein CIRG_06264 [Coccidioides immitis RMSCC 2394]KMU73746.1 hypothetical protein CISG_03796 [Coccidioides immitis RMSCC 3703]KMU84153.1 hypothetical protein CIHG_01939 [Coccidioides immitis H538.4]
MPMCGKPDSSHVPLSQSPQPHLLFSEPEQRSSVHLTPRRQRLSA